MKERKEKKKKEKKKKAKKKERKKERLAVPILNLPRPPRPVLVQVGTNLDTFKVIRLGRY